MFRLSRSNTFTDAGLTTSTLYDQDDFYTAFTHDLSRARTRVIIESPFLTLRRVNILLPILRKLRSKNVRIIVNTKPFDEHDTVLREQAVRAVDVLQSMGVDVLMTVGHHRKLAIIDDALWEGSLNILSQNDSCELMRRIQSTNLVAQTIQFIGLDKWALWLVVGRPSCCAYYCWTSCQGRYRSMEGRKLQLGRTIV